MIDDLDRSIEQLFIASFGLPLPFDLSFAKPDNTFLPISTGKNTLNCYLYDIRERRDWRTAKPVFHRGFPNMVEEELAPVRVKISYCLTAWSAAQPSPGMVPAFDEHLLLSKIMRVLLTYPVLPADVLVGTMKEQPYPLATETISVNSTIDSRDFWNAIGGQLRPSLDYSVTIAQPLPTFPAGPVVTTIRMDYREEEVIILGGRVVASTDAERGIADAWVYVVETGGTYMTNEKGQFVVERIVRGSYTFRARAVGFQEGTRTVQVPQPDGSYDLVLTPL
jgi:hypothetical protein